MGIAGQYAAREQPRYLLKPHEGKIVSVRAVVGEQIADNNYSRRGQPLLVLRDITVENSDEATPHCYVRIGEWWNVRRDENVRFKTRVIRYERSNDRSVDWTLDGYALTEFQVIRRGKWVNVEPTPEAQPFPIDADTAAVSPPPLPFAEGVKIIRELQQLFDGHPGLCRDVVHRLPGLIDRAGGCGPLLEMFDAMENPAADDR
jgi:hypothetical protein